jgi:hypothetical protein
MQTMRTENPTWDGPFFGEFGVLVDDEDRAQCHVCGDFLGHLGGHVNQAHGLSADEYRRAFGLKQSTKLIGPSQKARKSTRAGNHLRTVDSPRREKLRSLTTDERRVMMAKATRRREHELLGPNRSAPVLPTRLDTATLVATPTSFWSRWPICSSESDDLQRALGGTSLGGVRRPQSRMRCPLRAAN